MACVSPLKCWPESMPECGWTPAVRPNLQKKITGEKKLLKMIRTHADLLWDAFKNYSCHPKPNNSNSTTPNLTIIFILPKPDNSPRLLPFRTGQLYLYLPKLIIIILLSLF